MERLAAEAGLSLPAPDPRSAEHEKKRQGLSDWMGLAAQWFSRMLAAPQGVAARAYLERRGLPASDWERFGLGFAPAGRTGLKDYLVAKGARPRFARIPSCTTASTAAVTHRRPLGVLAEAALEPAG